MGIKLNGQLELTHGFARQKIAKKECRSSPNRPCNVPWCGSTAGSMAPAAIAPSSFCTEGRLLAFRNRLCAVLAAAHNDQRQGNAHSVQTNCSVFDSWRGRRGVADKRGFSSNPPCQLFEQRLRTVGRKRPPTAAVSARARRTRWRRSKITSDDMHMLDSTPSLRR